MPFGIPIDESAVEQVNNAVQANMDDILPVITAATEHITSGITANNVEVGKLKTRLNKVIKDTVGVNATDLGPVVAASELSLAGGIAANAADFATGLAAVPGFGGPPDTFGLSDRPYANIIRPAIQQSNPFAPPPPPPTQAPAQPLDASTLTPIAPDACLLPGHTIVWGTDAIYLAPASAIPDSYIVGPTLITDRTFGARTNHIVTYISSSFEDVPAILAGTNPIQLTIPCPVNSPSPPVPPPPPPPPPPPEPIPPPPPLPPELPDVLQPKPTPVPQQAPTETQAGPCSVLQFPAPPETQGFNALGSDEFCANLASMTQTVGNFGNTILDWMIGILNEDAIIGQLDPVPPEGILYGVWGNIKHWLVTLINILKCASKSAIRLMHDSLTWIRAAGNAFMPQGTVLAIGIWIVKTLVRTLEKMRVGTDAGLWLTIDVSVEFAGFIELLDRLSDYVTQMEIPGISDAVECYLKGSISEELAKCWIQLRGGNWDVWYHVIRSRRERLDAREIIEYSRRAEWDISVTVSEMQKLGFTDIEDIKRQIIMYDEIPSIADHLHWLQRNVFNDEYVAKYKLLDGFEERFWVKYGPDLRTKGMLKSTAANHYAAHWIMPSPEQMRQFVFRLRPGRVPDDRAFTAADYDRILQEQDYNVLARQWFVDTINPVPAISYIKRMFQLGVIDDVLLKSYHMDLGYTDRDSDNFVGVDIVDRQHSRTSGGHGFTPSAMANAYAVRQMPADEIYVRMKALGYPKEIADDMMRRADIEFQRPILIRARARMLTKTISQVTNAITTGTMDVATGSLNLRALGWPAATADSVASLADQDARTSLAKAGIARIRTAYLLGEVNATYAGGALSQLGIIPSKIQQYITVWNLTQNPSRKRRTAAQISKDVCSGQISTGEALARLHNLGYTDADSRLFMADAIACVHKTEEKMRAASLKVGKARTAEMAKLVRQTESQKRRLVNDLRRLEPVSKLQKWLKLGIINDDYFRRRLSVYGYNASEIDALRTESEKAAGKKKGPPKP